jgi:hypothetical protein
MGNDEAMHTVPPTFSAQVCPRNVLNTIAVDESLGHNVNIKPDGGHRRCRISRAPCTSPVSATKA